MVSTKYFTTARLYWLLFIIFNHSTGMANTYDTNRISVTDFKYFRKIEYKNKQLLLYKNPSIKTIYYLSDRFEFNFIKKNNQFVTNFKSESQHAHNTISFANNKSTFISTPKNIYFDSSNNSICEKILKEKVASIDGKNFTKGIKASNIASLTDKTCDETQKEKISEAFANMLDSESAWLTNCYGNKIVDKLIAADEKYLAYSIAVYSKYLNLAKKLGEGAGAIQISCQTSTSDKLGSFDETTTPPKISLNWETLSKKTISSNNKFEDNIKETLGHELFHYGAVIQTPETLNYNTCINEEYAKLFTGLCSALDDSGKLSTLKNKYSEQIRDQKITTSKEIEIACKSKAELSGIISANISLKTKNTDGESGTAAAEADNKLQLKKRQEYLNATLNDGANPIKPSDYTRPTDSDFAILASITTPNTKNGQEYTVPANSTFGQTVQKMMNSFNNSGNTLTTKLNSALAATTNNAEATKTTLAATNSNTTTTSSTYTPTSTSTSKTTQTNDVSNTKSRMPANVEDNSGNYSGTSGKTSSGTAGQASEMAGGSSTGGSSKSFYTGTGNLGNTNAGKNEASQYANSINRSGSAGFSGASSGGGSSTASTSAQKTAEQRQAEGSDIVKTIQSLKAFNTVTGVPYQEIKKYYNNSYFQNLLQINDMRIMVKNPAGQYVTIGVDTKKAKKVFNDDGQILKTVEKK